MQQVQLPAGYQLISNDPPPPDPQASALQGAVAYGSTQNPDKYAKLLQIQKETGISPLVSDGNEDLIHQAAANTFNYPVFVAKSPRTASWASNPDNAAVSGVPEIHRLGGIEQNVQQMDQVSAYTPGMWESLKGHVNNTWDAAKQQLYAYPLTRMAIATAAGLVGTAGDVGSFVGWHGDGPTKQNMLQSVESSLKPENVFKHDPYAGAADYSKSTGMDQVAPLLASMAMGVGEGAAVGWAARMFGWSERAAKVATALSVGATFSAQQGGAAYTQTAAAGGDDDAARLAANRTFGINLPGNTLAGFADMIPGLKENPLLASVGTGALMGASGKLGSNIVTGQPWSQGLLMAAGQAAAIQGGLHLGMSQFHANLADAIEAADASELRKRAPQNFADAVQSIASDSPSLRIPVDEFNAYFAGQKINPQAAAAGLGSTNYAEAHLSGGDVEVPKAGFLASLDKQHQMALFPHVVDPSNGLTPTQWEQGRQELTDWESSGGTEKLQADMAAAHEETAASPEYAEVKEDLRARYVAAGETPEVAETLATKDANVFTNLAREANLKPSELVAMYNPKVVAGEAPATEPPVAEGMTRLYHGSAETGRYDGSAWFSTDRKYAESYRAGGELQYADYPTDKLTEKNPDFGPDQPTMNVELSSEETGLRKPLRAPSARIGNTLHQKAIEDIRSVVESAKQEGHAPQKATIAPVHSWIVDAAKENGIDIEGYSHVIDGSAVRHVINRHGNEATETSRGQLPVSDADFEKIPSIIDKPDQVVLGTKTKGNKDQIGYMKRLEDGTTLYLEEARTGKKELAAVSMRKYPATKDFDDIAATLPSNARGDGGNKPIIVWPRDTDEILHQSQIPNWFRKLPAAAEGEEHPSLVQLRERASASGVPLTEEQDAAAKEAIEAAARGDDEVWSTAQEKYQKLRDEDPRTAQLRAARETYSKLQEKVTENPTPESLGALEDARKVVDAEQAKLAANAVKPGQPRGWFRTLPDGSFEIGKTKIGDLSTFVHEPAHAYLFMLRDLAGRDGASETLKSDYAKVLKFLDVKEGEPLTTEQHEKWALANEQYLREGKAPSAGLKGVFQRFAIWLGSVYQRATDLGVELSPEIRDVFDRMYAAEEGVNRAEAEAGPQLFKTPEEAGFTQKQFDDYAAQNEMTVEQAKAEILAKLNEAAERDRTAAWREEQRNVRQAMTDSIDAQPAQKAIRSLRKGELEDGTPLTLNRQALVDQFGEERVKALQDVHRGIYRNEGGTDAETAAEIHGFGSGEEMMQALEATPRRSAAIEDATRTYMTAKHGDIRYDGTLGDQARLALENNHKANVLHGELLALKQKIADMKGTKAALRAIDVAPIAAYREMAEQAIEQKSIVDLQPTRYLDASRKYSRESFEASIKGNAEAAAEAKHKELLNHFLFREAQQQQDYVRNQFEPFRKRVVGKTVQQNLGKAGPEYRAQFNQLMARYGIAYVERSEAPTGTLAQWASDQYDMGKEPAIDPAIYNEQRTANYRSIPLSELHQVHDALQNIRALAYQELHMVVNGRRVEFAKASAEMIARATSSLSTKPGRVLERNATFGEKAADLVQRGDALLMRTERLMEWLDGGKTGPWHDNLWHLAADSQGQEYAMQEEVTKKIGDSLEAMSKEQRMKMQDKVTIPGITEPITRHDLVSMALNMGNDGNFDRLSKTFEAHGWNPDALEHVKGALTREEWQHVQNLWDMLKPLGERMKAMERRLTGVPPAMVKPTPFRVAFADGTHMDLDGGYYPIMMDARFSKVGAAADAGMSAQNLMETGYGRAETSKGYTKGRTGYGGPLLLDYEQVLTQHTAKVIKDITHREFMLTANKLLMDQGIRGTLRGTLGDAYEAQMMPWLRTIINDRNGSATQGLGDFSRWMRAARTNMVMATIPFKIGTSLLQWTHAPRMLLSTNAGSFAQSLVAFMAHPSEMTQQIRDLSPNEMRFRGENLDRDVRAAINGQPGLRKTVVEAGNVSIKYTDHLLSFPLWHSVYQDALKEHIDLPEAEAQYQAVQKADSAVRLGLGSASPKDLPPIMRNNDLSKFLTTFYSFHNGIYGQVRDIAHQVNGWSDVPKMTYGMALAVVVPSLIGSLVTGHGPKDDENVGLWAAKRALLFSADTIPFVRDVASAMDGDGDVKFNPLMNVLSKGTKAMQAATAEKEDKDWVGIGLNALETAGDLSGVPGTTQVMKPLHYLDNVSKGKVDNPNVWDAFVGSAPHK